MAMCESKLILKDKRGGETLLMSEVINLTPLEKGIRVTNILGQEATYEYELDEISLISHKITVKERL